MKEYGVCLKEQRERLGITIEKASNDTKITAQVIEALEHMERDRFPSQTHLVGMLKLYSSYLQLDVSAMVELLQINEVQEKPIDFALINMEQQKKKKNKKTFLISGIVTFIAIALFVLVWYRPMVYGVFTTALEAITKSKAKKHQDIDNLVEIKGLYENTFGETDQVVLSVNTVKKILSINSIDPPRITIDGEKFTLALYQRKMIDIDGDGTSDYTVILRSVDTVRSQLLLRLDPRIEQVGEIDSNTDQVVNTIQDITATDGKTVEIVRAPFAIPINLQLLFSNDTYYQVETDAKKYEGNAQKDVPVEITSSNKIIVYLSIDTFVTIKVNNKAVDFERTNLPAVFNIEWYKENNENILMFFPLR